MPLLAVLLRFEGVLPAHETEILRVWLLPCTVIGIGVFYLFGMYHRIWHYARIRDLYAIVGAVTLFSAGKFLLLFLVGGDLPKSVFLISWMLTLGGIGLSRLAFKINLDIFSNKQQEQHAVLIIGAGDAGAMLVREIEQNDAATVRIVGFADDDAKKIAFCANSDQFRPIPTKPPACLLIFAPKMLISNG